MALASAGACPPQPGLALLSGGVQAAGDDAGSRSPVAASLAPAAPAAADDDDDAAAAAADTEDFFMYSYKVLPCPHSADPEHCQEDCPYAHPAEKATRRDPRAYRYTGVSCPSYRKGSCKDGDACLYAHGVFEVWLHPSRFRTELCKDGPGCTRKCCFFAHTPAQLRQAPPPDPLLPVPASKAAVVSRANSTTSSSGSVLRAESTTSDRGSISSSTTTTTARSAFRLNSSSPLRRPLVRSLTPSLGSFSGPAPAGLPHSASFGSSLFVQPAALCASMGGPLAAPVAASVRVLGPSAGPLRLGLLDPTAASTATTQQHTSLHAPAAAAAAASGGGRMLPVPLDIALEAAMLAGAASGAHAEQQHQHQQPVLQLPAGLEAPHQVPISLAALASGVVPAPADSLHTAGLGLLPGVPPGLPPAAAAAHHIMQAQQQELAAALMLQQALQAEHEKAHQQEQQLQQEQVGAMWMAAFNAARGIGLAAPEAAACADCAVQQTVASSPPSGPGAALALAPPAAAVGCVAPQALQQQQQPGPAALAALFGSSSMPGAQVNHTPQDALLAAKLADSGGDVLSGLLSAWGSFRV